MSRRLPSSARPSPRVSWKWAATGSVADHAGDIGHDPSDLRRAAVADRIGQNDLVSACRRELLGDLDNAAFRHIALDRAAIDRGDTVRYGDARHPEWRGRARLV